LRKNAALGGAMPARLMSQEFKGLRIQVESDRGFDEIVRRLHEQTGRTTIGEITGLAATASSSEDFHKDVSQRFVGPSGFMVFAEFDHGGWISRYGINRRVLRVILGNPLIAITLMRHDISAGLFAPVEILLVDHESGPGSTVHYVRPSTLMMVDGNPELASAALELDRKLDLLISNITDLGGRESARA
jgi:uncharacterized protein (DUF302 family)